MFDGLKVCEDCLYLFYSIVGVDVEMLICFIESA
jgi:hypothetical protein